MFIARAGYIAIIGIIAIAAVATAIVLQPDDASHNPTIEVQQVVNYARFGLVESIDVRDTTMTVRFVEGFDAEEAFGADSRVFEATLGEGEDIVAMLEAAGVPIGDDGVRVRRP
jgi:hypothetical protein